MKDDMPTIEHLEKSVSRMKWITALSLLGALAAILGIHVVSPANAQPAQVTFLPSISTRQLAIMNSQNQTVMYLNTNVNGVPVITLGRPNQNAVITPTSFKETAPNGSVIEIGYPPSQIPTIYMGKAELNLSLGFSGNRPGMWLTSAANGENLTILSNYLKYQNQNGSYAGLATAGFEASASGGKSTMSSSGFTVASSVGTGTLTASSNPELKLVTADGQQAVRLNISTNGLASKLTKDGSEDDWPHRDVKQAAQDKASK